MTCTQGHLLRHRDCPHCGQLDPPENGKAPVPGALDARPAKSSIADTDDLARGRIPVLRRDVVEKLGTEMRNRGDAAGLVELLLDVYDGLADQLADLAERGGWACMRDALGRMAAELALANDECDRLMRENIENDVNLARAAEIIRDYRSRNA